MKSANETSRVWKRPGFGSLLRAEALKSRHAAPGRLSVILALPFPLAALAIAILIPPIGLIFAPWNYWYALLMPVTISLVTARSPVLARFSTNRHHHAAHRLPAGASQRGTRERRDGSCRVRIRRRISRNGPCRFRGVHGAAVVGGSALACEIGGTPMRESQQTSVQIRPRITLARALRAENLRLRHSRLIPLHLVCALGAGITCGTYFGISPWDPAMGSDAFVQLLGAMMPLMAGIICGLDADAEGTDTAYANLLAMPSRIRIFTARVGTLRLRGALALALAVATFAVILLLAGRQTLGLEAWAGAIAGLAFGSIPLFKTTRGVGYKWQS